MVSVYGNVLEYYLANGKIRIGKNELIFELLRKDSVLRELLGPDVGDISSMLSATSLPDEGNEVVVDIGRRERQKLDGDPAPMLNEMKQRYGGRIGGTLTFSLYYTTHKTVSYLQANLDADIISLQLLVNERNSVKQTNKRN